MMVLRKTHILLWDSDGTIMGAKDPNDPTKIILPGVREVMGQATLNCIISGFKSSESEKQNFDPEMVIARFKDLMGKLPVSLALFSPAIGGIACYALIKKTSGELVVKKMHEDARYQPYIGDFKKPGIGMFVAARDLIREEFGLEVDAKTATMIGDTWHDEAAALAFGIPFVHADVVHKNKRLI